MLEMAHDLPEARGFLIFGTPPMPIGYDPVVDRAFLPNTAAAAAIFAERLDPSGCFRGLALCSRVRRGSALLCPRRPAHGRARTQVSRSQRSALRISRRGRSRAQSESPARHSSRRPGAVDQRRIYCFARHADAVARRRADDPQRRSCPSMGDAAGLRRTARGRGQIQGKKSTDGGRFHIWEPIGGEDCC
jgi:hypothetical protein